MAAGAGLNKLQFMRSASWAYVAASLLLVTSPTPAVTSDIPSKGLPTASTYSPTLLPELQGVVSWSTLSQVEPIKQGDKIVLQFSDAILELDSKAVRVQGFMLPLDLGDKQHHFLLSAVPPHCPFCMPAGPDAIVEIVAKQKVAYSFEPVILSGKFAVLKNDPAGVLYRLTEAEPIALSRK
jgi:uncharacterized protein